MFKVLKGREKKIFQSVKRKGKKIYTADRTRTYMNPTGCGARLTVLAAAASYSKLLQFNYVNCCFAVEI